MTNLCDNCKREPEQFEIEACGGGKVKVYWIQIPKTYEPVEYTRCTFVMKEEHPEYEDYEFLCKRCMGAILKGGSDEDEVYA